MFESTSPPGALAGPTLLQLSLLGGASFREVTELLGSLTWAEASAPHAGLPHTLADVIWHLSVTQRASLNIASGRADGWPDDLNVWPAAPLTEPEFTAAHADLLAGLPEAQALARDPSSRARDVLTDLAVHSAYHWGQVALLRRLTGTLPAAGGRVSVFVGSLNPGKVRPVQEVFTALATELGLPSGAVVQGVNVPSGVPDQPIGVPQTALGVANRAAAALAQPGALWGVGLEGGVRLDEGGRGWLFGVVAVAHAAGVNAGRTAELPVPPAILPGVLGGQELGTLMDELLGTQDLKRGVGTVGALTGGLVTRPDVWRQALALTLAPFLHPHLYPASGLFPRG